MKTIEKTRWEGGKTVGLKGEKKGWGGNWRGMKSVCEEK